MGGLSSLGVGSGLDAGALVDRLVAAERAGPQRRLDRSEVNLRASLSAFGQMRAALDTLQESLPALEGLGGGRSARVAPTGNLRANAADGATEGRFRVTVDALARAQSLAAAGYAGTDSSVGTGTLSIRLGAADPVAVQIEAGSDSLAEVRDAINAAEAGVSAAIIDDGTAQRLVLTAAETGAANAIEITVSDDDGNDTDAIGLSALAFAPGAMNLAELVGAEDAQLRVNGLAVTRGSNSIDDLIDGVTLDLSRADPDLDIEVSVASDSGSARAALDKFVEAFNGVLTRVEGATRFDPESGQGSPLTGDSTARGLVSALRNTLLEGGDGEGPFARLLDLGVRTGENGRLSIDDDRFDAALAEDFGAVGEVLGGVAERFEATVATFVGDGGRFAARTDGLETRLEDIADRRVALDRRIDLVEARFRREFGALDVLISNLQSTSGFLASQLANLPTPGGGDG